MEAAARVAVLTDMNITFLQSNSHSSEACIDPASAIWTSGGGGNHSRGGWVSHLSSHSFRFSRFLLFFAAENYSTSTVAANSVVVDALDGNGEWSGSLGVLSRSKSVPSVFHLSGVGALVMELPVGSLMPPSADRIRLNFSLGSPLTVINNPNNTAALLPVRMLFVHSSATFIIAETVFRYISMGFVVLLVIAAIGLHTADDDDARFAVTRTVLFRFQNVALPGFVTYAKRRWRLFRLFVASKRNGDAQATKSAPLDADGSDDIDYPPTDDHQMITSGHLPFLVRWIVLVALLNILSSDPLAVFFTLFPQNGALQFWALHFVPWLRTSTMVIVTGFVFAYLTNGAAFLMSRRDFVDCFRNGTIPYIKIAVLSLLPPSLYLVSVVWAVEHNQLSNPSGIGDGGGRNRDGAEVSSTDGSAIAATIAVYLPLPFVLFLFWRYRNNMLFRKKQGVDDVTPSLYGTHLHNGNRVGVLWVRAVSGVLVLLWVMYDSVYFAILNQTNLLLPTPVCGQVVEVLVLTSLQLTMTLLSLPFRYLLTVFPPHPTDCGITQNFLRRKLAERRMEVSGTWLRRSDEVGPETPSTPLIIGAKAEGNRNVVRYNEHVAVALPGVHDSPPPSALSVSGAEVAASYRNDDVTLLPDTTGVLTQPEVPLWMKMWWQPTHFSNLVKRKLSGFAFDVEAQRDVFEFYNATLNRERESKIMSTGEYAYVGSLARSFFCWETAVRCLNISNEAYMELSGEEDLETFIEVVDYQQTCCESCMTRCLCCTAASSDGCCGGTQQSSSQDVIPAVEEHERTHGHSSRRFVEESDLAIPITADDGNEAEGALPIATPQAVGKSPSASPKNALPEGYAQVNVGQYGYKLFKVMDIFGVRVLVAYTPQDAVNRTRHLCISFRGTANLRNAITDLHVSSSVHPEMLHKYRCQGMKRTPFGEAVVHSGFLAAFTAIKQRLFLVIQSFFQSHGNMVDAVICTGHSLGGALAMLCSYSLREGEMKGALRAAPVQIMCYTFGSPKLGNDAFASEYNTCCPETYRVVNENDPVSWWGVCSQIHAGRQVLINRDGDTIIEGSALESLYLPVKSTSGSAFKNHLLNRYANALDNCLSIRNRGLIGPSLCSFLLNYKEEDKSDK